MSCNNINMTPLHVNISMEFNTNIYTSVVDVRFKPGRVEDGPSMLILTRSQYSRGVMASERCTCTPCFVHVNAGRVGSVGYTVTVKGTFNSPVLTHTRSAFQRVCVS